MDAYWKLLFLILQCFSWCDSYERTSTFQVSVQSFQRESKAKRFLTCERPENGKAFRISFTGRKYEPGTKFILERKWTTSRNAEAMQFTLRPARFPDYILVEEEGTLAVKNISSVDPAETKYNFQMSRVTLQYRDAALNRNVTEYYYIIQTRSRLPAVLKSSRSGKVSLDKWKNWKDSRAWFKLQRIS